METIIKPAVESLKSEGYNIRGYYADRQERWIPHNEMSDYYNSIDICVCASLTEGSPDPVLEAMACGVPVISTDVGIVPEVFGILQKDYILSSRTVDDLKLKLKDLLENPQKLKLLSKENMESVKKRSWEIQCQKWNEFFTKMLVNSEDKYINQHRNSLRKQTLDLYLKSSSNSKLIKNLESKNENLEIEIDTVQNRLSELKKWSKELQTVLSKSEKYVIELEKRNREIESHLQKLDKQIEILQSDAKELNSEIETKHSEIENLTQNLETSMNVISTMQSSKFWKIRDKWFKLQDILSSNKK